MNFLEPTVAMRIGTATRRIPKIWLAAILSLGVLAAIESIRLEGWERRAADLGFRRDALVTRLQREENRAAALERRVRVLRAALEIRRATALRASEIAGIGNALPGMVALTALRENNGSWQVEGKGPYLGAVRAALTRLNLSSTRSEILDVRRDPRGEVVSFQLELGRR